MCKGHEADGNVRNSKQLARLDPENKRQEWQLQGPVTGTMEICLLHSVPQTLKMSPPGHDNVGFKAQSAVPGLHTAHLIWDRQMHM